jgi:hypothetical protein
MWIITGTRAPGHLPRERFSPMALRWPNLPCALKAAIGIGKRTLGPPSPVCRAPGGRGPWLADCLALRCDARCTSRKAPLPLVTRRPGAQGCLAPSSFEPRHGQGGRKMGQAAAGPGEGMAGSASPFGSASMTVGLPLRPKKIGADRGSVWNRRLVDASGICLNGL